MRAPILPLSRGDILGILFGLMIVATLILGYLYYPTLIWQRGSRANFGSDWDCQYVPKSEPVCIKRIPPRKDVESKGAD